MNPAELSNALNKLTYECYQNAVSHGFYENTQLNLGEKLMLIVTELSEGFEGVRKDGFDRPDEHCPTFSNFEIEIADTFIRLFDLCGAFNLRIGEAVLAKHEYNKGRPHKHGKAF